MDSIKPANDGELLKVLTRLMIPFRREFQQFLDVNRLLVDQGYAKEIVDKLQHSDNPNTVSAGQFLRNRMKVDTPAMPTELAPANSPPSPEPPAAVNALAPSEAAAPSLPDQATPKTKYVTRLR